MIIDLTAAHEAYATSVDRTVGIDRSYYAPVPPEDWQRYASQLPPDFECCIKAPAAITSYTAPPQPRPATTGGSAPGFE